MATMLDYFSTYLMFLFLHRISLYSNKFISFPVRNSFPQVECPLNLETVATMVIINEHKMKA